MGLSSFSFEQTTELNGRTYKLEENIASYDKLASLYVRYSLGRISLSEEEVSKIRDWMEAYQEKNFYI